MVWHLLPTISAPMSFQMALDEALFQKAKEDPEMPPLIRFYHSSEPWITVGCSFRDIRDASRSELIKTNPRFPVAKRLTGGGCVLHGKDLIFSLIVRFEAIPALATVKTSYARIHACVAAAFQKLGFDPRFYQESEELPKGDDCFTYPVASDLSWKGQKLAGGAQKRSGGFLLHHESVRVPRGVNSGSLIRAIQAAFEKELGADILETNLDPDFYFQATKQL